MAAILAVMVVITYLFLHTQMYFTAGLLGGVLALQVWWLYKHLDAVNRDLIRFLTSAIHADFSASFSSQPDQGTYGELRRTFDTVLRKFRTTRIERERQSRYLKAVLDHARVGMIAFDQQGRIDFMNRAAAKIIHLGAVSTLESVAQRNPRLAGYLRNIRPGQTRLAKIEIAGDTLQLTMAASEVRLGERTMRLVSFQDIAGELARRDLQAWQQLVRVLTHEIMNSVTPITSLAGTVRGMLEDGQGVHQSEAGLKLDEHQTRDLSDAVATIERRGEGLIRFVQAYRNLTRIPQPAFQIVRVDSLLKDSVRLFASQDRFQSVEFVSQTEPATLELTADPDLIGQVLINLMTNAAQAMGAQTGGRILLRGELGAGGHVVIRVIDNGPGISTDSLESVFVPFYTTKKDGTGIGLSLSRQIMHLHKGDISVLSEHGQGAVFALRF